MTDALDPGALVRLRANLGGDDAEVLAVVGSYLEEAPSLLLGLRQAAERGDRAGLRRPAHTLKSLSKSVGARELAQLCMELEAWAAGDAGAGSVEPLAHVARAEEAFAQARDALAVHTRGAAA